MASPQRKTDTLVLFDIDGTLTPSRLTATEPVMDMIKQLREKVYVGVVGGSDFVKQQEQLGANVLDLFDYNFPENGVVAYEQGKQIHSNSIRDFLGEDKLKEFINWVLRYIADLDIPIKRGTFIEFRTGMINLSPIGRNCTHFERLDFFEYDTANKIRETMVRKMDEEFGARFDLKFSIGGQISIDVFPRGWDKTYCLKHVQKFSEIHFFGDKTAPGGNDYEIYSHAQVKGHSVISPADTIEQVTALFFQN